MPLLFSGWMFHPQIAVLKSQYRCVAIVWRSQGDSAATNDGYDMDTLTDDAVALIESLGVAPIHYVGLSVGGFVGQRIAARLGFASQRRHPRSIADCGRRRTRSSGHVQHQVVR
jgi:3-oxoadipate enol-lactonase